MPFGLVAAVTSKGPCPGLAAIGRAMHAHGLHVGRVAELLDQDRRVDEHAIAEVLDFGVAEDLREARGADHVVAGRRQLAAVDERLAAILRIHESRHGNRVQGESARVIESDDDVLAALIDGDRELRLAAGNFLLFFVALLAAFRLVETISSSSLTCADRGLRRARCARSPAPPQRRHVCP